MYSPIKDANQDPKKDLKRLELVLNGAGLGIWDWYIETGEVVFNQEWKRMLGYEMNELKDEFKTWEMLIHPDDKEATYTTLNNYIKNRKTDYYESEHRLKHKDGTYRWILDIGRIVESRQNPDDVDGGLIAVRATGVHQDITRRKKLELKLEEEKEKLAQTNHIKTSFIANMSHEIRTPINGILGATELLQEEKKDHDKNLIKIIKNSTQHLLDIVNDILDFSKIEAGNAVIKNEQVYLPDLMEKIKSMYYPKMYKKELNFFIKIQPESLEKIYFLGDQKRLLQIILNLLNNSIKFTKKGSITLKIIINTNDNEIIDKPTIKIIVKDTGRGMSEEFLKKIFVPFLQEQHTKSRDQGGTGLGTTIVKKLVDQMNGTIDVKSKLGQGSVFTISLPLNIIPQNEGEKIANKNRRSSDVNIEECDYKGKKILLVEDNELNAKVAKLILERINLNVHHARNGQEVLDMVHKHNSGKNSHRNFELILMDNQLPIYDGETLTRILRQEGYQMPIIALTANVYADDIERYLKSGMNDFLGKPYKIQELIYILNKYI